MRAVSYSLVIDGVPADERLINAIRQIEVEDHAELADMLRLKVAVAVDSGGGRWTVLDDSVFNRLTPIRLSVTIGAGPAEPLIDAYVVETRGDFSNRPGESMLEVIAMDSSILMNLEEKVRTWPDMADSDIANVLFGEYNLTPSVDQTQPNRQQVERTVIQRGTDIQFLRELAERNGFECYVEIDPVSGVPQGHFHPPRVDERTQGVLTVNMGSDSNVNHFKTRYEMLRPMSVEAGNLDTSGQSAQSGEAQSSSLTELGAEAATRQSGNLRKILVANTGLTDSGELQTFSQALVNRSAFAIRAEGELNTVTYENVLRAKRPVNVRGAGRQFSGTYYVEKVLHTISDQGYTQSFTLRRNASGVTGGENFTEDRALAS